MSCQLAALSNSVCAAFASNVKEVVANMPSKNQAEAGRTFCLMDCFAQSISKAGRAVSFMEFFPYWISERHFLNGRVQEMHEVVRITAQLTAEL